MPDLNTRIIITGQDRASEVWRKVGLEAEAAKQRMLGVNKGADQTAALFQKLSREAGQARRRLQELDGAGARGGLLESLGFGGLAAGAFSAYGLVNFSQAAIDASRQVQSMERAILTASGSADAMTRNLQFLRGTSDELGQNFYVLAESYKSVAAASRGTSLEGEGVNKVFRAVVEASTALGLSGEDTKGALVAIGQMMSKGKVAAEELRQQLGERLPGAFALAAEAMGVSTQELDKMLERGQVGIDLLPKLAEVMSRAYGPDAKKAAEDSARAVDKMSEAWTRLKATTGDTSLNLLEQDIKDVTWGVNLLAEGVEGLSQAWKAFKAMGAGELGKADWLTMDREERKEFVAGFDTPEGLEKRIASLRQAKMGKLYVEERADIDARIKELNRQLDSAFAVDAAKRASAAEKTMQRYGGDLLLRGLGHEGYTLDQSYTLAKAREDEAKKAQAEQEKAATALSKLNSEIAKLTMTPHDLALFELNQQVEDLTKLLGANHPRLKEYVELRKQAIEADVMSDPLFKDAYDKAQRGTAAQRLLHDVDADAVREAQASAFQELHERNLQVLTDFDQEYRRVVLGETEFKLAQIEEQARVWQEAGADEVRVAQWMEEEKKKLLAHTSQDYAAGWASGMDKVVKDTKSGYELMESLSQSTFSAMGDSFGDLFHDAVTGKLRSLGDYVTSFFNAVLRSMSQLYGQQLAGGVASGLAGWWGSSGSLTASQRSEMLSNYSRTGSVARAGGGVIDEPVLGVGLATGRTWTFGEKGREWVTPGGQPPGGGTTIQVLVENRSGVPVAARQTSVEDQPGRKVIRLVMEAVAGNIEGSREFFFGA